MVTHAGKRTASAPKKESTSSLMVATSKSQKTKTVKIKHHHKKPYRKRHVSGLVVASLCAIFLIAYAWQYSSRLQDSLSNAQSYIQGVFGNRDNDKGELTQQSVTSTYGYSLLFDRNKFYATAVDTASGDLYVGSELSTTRAYKTVRLSPIAINLADGVASMSLQYRDDVIVADTSNPDLSAIEKTLVEQPSTNAKSTLTKFKSENTTISGKTFYKTIWQRKANSELVSQVVSTFTTYTGIVNDKPFIITINQGFTSDGSKERIFSDIVDSIGFGEITQSLAPVSSGVAQKTAESNDLLNKLTLTGQAFAAVPEAGNAEKNSAKYSPAVIKIYNVYCMDIEYEGKSYIKNACSASTGSGFFVTKDGYIATNGHVANSNPKDIVISHAFAQLQDGIDDYFNLLAQVSGLTVEEFMSKDTLKERVQLAVDKFYGIDDKTFVATNSAINLLVDLNEKQPDAEELIGLTKERKIYAQQDGIKAAKFIGADYRAIDGVSGYKASDVALIKIDGDNFPVVKVSSIDSVQQGAGINILGFPGNAGDNGVIDDKQSKVTLTSGKVSSVKNALGSSKKLLETDTTLGHGNSGGPVLNDAGGVVGIATYTVDGSGSGNGVFNYIRDIADLKDLASKKSVTISGELSKTQTEWEKGLDLFYAARYSKAIKSFEKVKTLYPQHPKVAEFTASAQQRIKDGQEVKDFPIMLVGAAAAVVVVIGAVSAVLIIRHKKAHNVYKAQVTTGAMQPVVAGAPPQQVQYNPAEVKATNNPLIVPTVQTPAPPVAPQPLVQPTVTPIAVSPVQSPQVAVVNNQPVAPVVQPQQPQATPIQIVSPTQPTVITPQEPPKI